MERAHSHPVRSSMVRQSSYNTLSNMNPRAYRRHAMAQLAKSETFYRRSSREEDDLQHALGLIGESEDEREASPDVEAPGQQLLIVNLSECLKFELQCML